jgi:hypothetical protein
MVLKGAGLPLSNPCFNGHLPVARTTEFSPILGLRPVWHRNRSTQIDNDPLVPKQVPGAKPGCLVVKHLFGGKDLDELACPAVVSRGGRNAITNDLVNDEGVHIKKVQTIFHPNAVFNFSKHGWCAETDTTDVPVVLLSNLPRSTEFKPDTGMNSEEISTF